MGLHKVPRPSQSPREGPAWAKAGYAAGRRLLAIVGLCAATAAAFSSPVAQPPSRPETPAGAAATRASFEALEVLGRAQPELASQRLQAWMDGLPPAAPERADALELLGWWQAVINDPQANERAAAQLEELAHRLPALRDRCLAAAALVRAKFALHQGSVPRAERLLTEALALLPRDLAPPQRIRYLLLAADVRNRASKYDDAMRWYLQASTLADAHLPAWRRAEVRSSMAYLLYRVGQKERARELNREAIRLAEQSGDEVAMSDTMTTESILLSATGQDAQELAALQAAQEHARRAGAKREQILTLANMADYHLQRGQYATALQVSERALPLARELRNPGSESLALTNIGLALISMNRKAEGMKHVQAALAIEERIGSLADMADTYQELGLYLERAGELKDAFEAYRQHRKLADDAFRQEQQQAILELQEGHDNQRRQRELELLNRENRLKDEQLLQRELQQRLWAMAVALGVLSIGVIVLLMQRARRANRRLARTNEQLKAQSERDPLTGLANRRHLQLAMRRAPDAPAGFSGTVYLLDVDHFKQINDLHGHAAGDTVLVETARRLRAMLREQDLVVRWGGEEFLVVVRSLSPEQVETLAQRLLNTMASEPMAAGDRQVRVTASIGFATFPLDPAGVALNWEQAIELVDTAMYLAKAHGRNRAYGIRLMHAADAAEVMQTAQTLEKQWQAGRVALTLLHGPSVATEPR